MIAPNNFFINLLMLRSLKATYKCEKGLVRELLKYICTNLFTSCFFLITCGPRGKTKDKENVD